MWALKCKPWQYLSVLFQGQLFLLYPEIILTDFKMYSKIYILSECHYITVMLGQLSSLHLALDITTIIKFCFIQTNKFLYVVIFILVSLEHYSNIQVLCKKV